MSVKATLPPGKYYIGDPCYAFPDVGPREFLWQDVCEIMEDSMNSGQNHSICDIPDVLFWAASTRYGDGVYYGSLDLKSPKNPGEIRVTDCEFSVDSGLLGIMPWETVEFLDRKDFDPEKVGIVVEFDKPFDIMMDEESGEFEFGCVYIDTDDVEEDYDGYDDI